MGIPTITPYAMPTAGQLPDNEASWRCEPARCVLLIHDMQRYFVDFFPVNRQPVTDLVENIAKIKALATRSGIPVIYTAQPGGMTRQQRGLLFDIWGPGMSAEASQRDILPEIGPTQSDTVLVKWRYSAFARSGLLRMLSELRRDQMIICGVYAHVGCLMTACDAFAEDIQAFLVADAIADFTYEYHHMALTYAAQRCAMTPLTERLLVDLGTPGKKP